MSEKNDNLNGADVSRETSEPPEQSTPPQRNKPSSFYVYLAILFGAAFLMLLLAYFVQQRNNETVRDNLRTATASREELLEDIQRLEEENLALQTMIDSLSAEQAELREAYDEEFSTNRQRQSELANQITSWSLFWSMESAYRAKDYETCAGFFQDEFTSETYTTPAEAEERVEEIYNDLLEQGFLTEDVPLPIVYTAK